MINDDIDIEGIFKKFNITKYIDRGNEIQLCCPFHDDVHPSMSYNKNKKLFFCHACGEKGTIIDFIEKLANVDEETAKKMIFLKDDDELMLANLRKEIDSLIVRKKDKIVNDIQYLDEKILEMFDYTNYDYMLNRGFKPEILKEFEIGYYKGFVTIPVRDEDNKLVAVLIRPAINDLKVKVKYKSLYPPKGYKKSVILYALNKIDKQERTVIIVEGPFDAIKAFQEGFRNVVAIQGSSLSKEQEKIILRRFDKAIIATDNDLAGREALSRIIKQLFKKITIMEFKYISDKFKDIGEMSGDEIKYGILEARIVV